MAKQGRGGEKSTIGEIASPCVGICKLDAVTGLCSGCLRSAEEISLWRDADNRLRLSILQRVSERHIAGRGATASQPTISAD